MTTTDTVHETITEHASTSADSTLPNSRSLTNSDNPTSTEPISSNNTDTTINEPINDNLMENSTPIDATNKFVKGDVLQIKTGTKWRTIQIQSKYRHNYARNRSKYRFKFTDNPNSAVTFEDFNQIPWRTLCPIDEVDLIQNTVDNDQNNASSVYLSDTNLNQHCKITPGEVHTVFATTVPYHLHNRADCIQAKRDELKSIQHFGTFKEVDIRTLTPEQKERIIPCS